MQRRIHINNGWLSASPCFPNRETKLASANVVIIVIMGARDFSVWSLHVLSMSAWVPSGLLPAPESNDMQLGELATFENWPSLFVLVYPHTPTPLTSTTNSPPTLQGKSWHLAYIREQNNILFSSLIYYKQDKWARVGI